MGESSFRRHGLQRERVLGGGKGGFSGLSAAKRRLDDRILEGRRALAGEPKATKAKPIAPWRLHDLRRTCATVMADQLGVLPHVVEAVLNPHQRPQGGCGGRLQLREV